MKRVGLSSHQDRQLPIEQHYLHTTLAETTWTDTKDGASSIHNSKLRQEHIPIIWRRTIGKRIFVPLQNPPPESVCSPTWVTQNLHFRNCTYPALGRSFCQAITPLTHNRKVRDLTEKFETFAVRKNPMSIASNPTQPQLASRYENTRFQSEIQVSICMLHSVTQLIIDLPAFLILQKPQSRRSICSSKMAFWKTSIGHMRFNPAQLKHCTSLLTRQQMNLVGTWVKWTIYCLKESHSVIAILSLQWSTS